MSETVESYRIALEQEISRWNGFARALRKDDREAFEELMDMGRSFASESSNATNPIIFEPMAMSILLAQQQKLRELENKLNEALWQKICAQEKQTQPQKQSKSPLTIPEKP
ncbi:hypothetical protein MUP77_24410 [Candidatus Bathyarchaeota archaeon]|nr:hypothetical protein [Candidatus Bathyarchaeota archaeon]